MPRATLRSARTARIVAIALALLPAGASHAQFGFLYEWNKPAGGAYAVNANWTPSGVPDASNEAAYFGLNSAYNVQLPTSDVTVSSLEVAQGFVGLTYSPSGMPATTFTANGGLTVGSTGEAVLRLNRAGQFAPTPSLTTGAATLGVNPGSDGQLRMLWGMWTAGATVIGAAGSGHFELASVETHATATTAGAVLGLAATGSGTANVAGTWNSGDLIVGDAGDAEVNIGVGSLIEARLNSGSAIIAAKNGSTGTVNVTGLDTSQFPFLRASDWIVAGSLAIGGDNASPGGVGRLAIGTLNKVLVGSDLKIWPGGTLSLRESGVLTVSGAANLSGALEFALFQTINPALGVEFEILTAASVAGTFSSTMLPPLANGLRWAVDYEPTSVSLRVASSFTADFDNDGDVDAADLTEWRGDFGVNSVSDADDDGDSDGDDFLQWQRQLGSPASVGAAIPVPEPSALAFLLSGAMGGGAALARRGRRRLKIARLRRPRVAVLTSVLLVSALAPAGVCQAQFGFFYEWNKPFGGAYAVNANWTPAGIPNASNEAASFGLSSTYNVQLPTSNVTVSSLEVAQGNVTLAFQPPVFPASPYSYTTTGGLTVGPTGQASLAVGGAGPFEAPARLTTGAASLGANAGSNGQFRILADGVWNGGSAVIGGAGSGRLDLDGFTNATTAGAVLGQGATGSGTAFITGRWITGDLIVADAGTAELRLFGALTAATVGRLDSANASIAAQSGSTGIVTVTGFTSAGGGLRSSWNVLGQLAVGGDSTSPGGVGQLTIGSGNIVDVNNLKIWPGGTLSLREDSVLIVGAANLGGTLEFLLSPTTTPQLGNEFAVFSAPSGVAGTFSSTILPPLADGLRWVVDYEATSVSLRVASSFTADFDNDGDVDAADLVEWRGDFGVNGLSDADADGDSDGGDFLQWQRQLGSLSPATLATATAPEPASLALLASYVLGLALRTPRL